MRWEICQPQTGMTEGSCCTISTEMETSNRKWTNILELPISILSGQQPMHRVTVCAIGSSS